VSETAVQGRATASASASGVRRKKRVKRYLLHAFLIVVSLIFLLPLAWAVYTSFRPYADTGGDPRGYVSIGGAYNLDNYIQAWTQGEMIKFFINTLIIVVPSVTLVLFLASMMAFTVSRYSWRFNLTLLMLFTAANLLPQQVLITPLFRMFVAMPLPEFLSDNGKLYDQYIGIILVHVAFQLGFCTFVLSNYMKTLPKELNEAATVDGASVWKTYKSVILPLTRPALAALATLQVTWIYNDFFWALILMFTNDKRPITSALNQLKGEFFQNNNLIAAGAIMVAIPTLLVFLLLQKQFVSGLTLGSTKG
jgi:multiple sugar transport system permease protein